MNELGIGLVMKIVGPVVAGISGYYNLPEYGKVLYKRARGKVLEYNQEEPFWKDAIGPSFYQRSQTKLREGQLVQLVDFEITEWFPRCPGLFWTTEGQQSRESAWDYVEDQRKYSYLVLSPVGKSQMILGGIGTTRLEVHKGAKQDYRVLCATSSGKCDAGIPLVVTKGVYNKIQDQIQSEGAVRADVAGLYSLLPIKYEDLVLETPGSELSEGIKSWISTALHVPRYCLQVNSRLQIKSRKSESIVRATAWTMFRTRDEDASFPYSFTYHSIDPKNENSIKEASEFIQEYVYEHEGREILTDFDERIPRFDSIYSLSKVMRSEVDQSIEQRTILDRAKGLTSFEQVFDY